MINDLDDLRHSDAFPVQLAFFAISNGIDDTSPDDPHWPRQKDHTQYFQSEASRQFLGGNRHVIRLYAMVARHIGRWMPPVLGWTNDGFSLDSPDFWSRYKSLGEEETRYVLGGYQFARFLDDPSPVREIAITAEYDLTSRWESWREIPRLTGLEAKLEEKISQERAVLSGPNYIPAHAIPGWRQEHYDRAVALTRRAHLAGWLTQLPAVEPTPISPFEDQLSQRFPSRTTVQIYRSGNAEDFLRENAPNFLREVTDNLAERLGYPREEEILYLPGVVEDNVVAPDGIALLVLNVSRPAEEYLMLVTGGSNEEVAAVAKALKHTWVLGNHHGYDIGQLEGGVK